MTWIFIFIFSILFYGCVDKSKIIYEFEFLDEIKLEIPEPSGLALSFDGENLWTVSDENCYVYLMDKNGNVKKDFLVDGNDLEGICVVDDSTICVVLERAREIVLLDTSGVELNRKKLDLEGPENNGLEGITYDVKKKNFYLVNEKNPGLLIKLDNDFNIISIKNISFSKDYSSISCDQVHDRLWILSDESKKLSVCDYDGIELSSYYINIPQPEGFVIDFTDQRLYVVSDSMEKLYIYESRTAD